MSANDPSTTSFIRRLTKAIDCRLIFSSTAGNAPPVSQVSYRV